MKDITKAEKKILDRMEKKKWYSTSKVSYLIRRDYYFVRGTLEELFIKGFLEKEDSKVNSSIYWRRK